MCIRDRYSEELCAALAEQFEDQGVDVVIGPAMGAVQMAYELSLIHISCIFPFSIADMSRTSLIMLSRCFEENLIFIRQSCVFTGLPSAD